MGNLDNIRVKIKQKEPVIGTGVSLNESSITEMLADCGFDFIWVDTEHSSIDKREVQSHIMAARGTGAAVFVRVAWNDPVLVKPILEMGPDGIVFPMIRTSEEARLAVSSCIYPTEGIRGFGPRRSLKYGLMDVDEFIKNSKSQIWKIMQIEHIDGVDNLDEILKIDGVDSIVVGPFDLSGSMGLLGQTDHPEVKKMMDIIGEKAVKSGKPFGVSMGYNPKVIKEWIDRGVSWIQVGTDVSFILKSAMESLRNTRDFFQEIRQG